MKPHARRSFSTPLLKCACVVLLVILASSCGGSSNSTTAPSTPSTSTRIIGLSGNLAFGNVTIGQSGTAMLTITNSGNTTLTVSGMTVASSISSAFESNFTSGTIPAGGTQLVTLRFVPTIAQAYNGTLTVTDDHSSGTNTIPISGTGILAAGVSPTRIIGLSGNLALGSVTVGQSSSATFTITNSGNSTLTVSGMTAPAGGAYTASWTSGTIPPGASQQVTVSFTPSAGQSYSGTLTVQGDQTSGINTIAISGTGVSSPSSPTPTPGGGKYDGTYDFFFKNPGPGGTTESHNLARFLIVRNSVVSSSDATVSGAVDSFGAVRFTGPCTINNSTADWIGNMNASSLAGANFGQGTYTCRSAIGGSSNTWQATQSR